MRLIRNTTADGTCKYALIRLDKLRSAGYFISIERFGMALAWIADFVEYGFPKRQDEFFVIKLQDQNARAALLAYAEEAKKNGDDQLACEVNELADRAGELSEFVKNPD